MIPNGKNRQCIIVFVKAPLMGRVKTRLSQVLGEETVLDLYKCFVADVIATLNSGRHGIRIFYHPPEEKQKIQEWLGFELPLFPQQGKDLGERMANAFKQSFSNDFKPVLLVGTDCPDLPGSIIDEAFEALSANAAVIGPAFDGGYYLVGFNPDHFFPAIFKNMPWGTEYIFERTMNVFASKRVQVYVLPKWRDIDRCEDLEYFKEKTAKRKSVAKNTVEYLSAHGALFRGQEPKCRKTLDEIVMKFD